MKLIDLLAIVCLGLAATATASSSSIEDRLGQVETLLDRFGRDNVFLRMQISDLKYEDGINKQKIAQLVQENKSIRAELVDVKKERQVDRDEIQKLKSQVESLREELEGAVSDIDDLKTKIQELESCGCGGGHPVTPIASTSTSETTNVEAEYIDVGIARKIEIFKDLDMIVVGGESNNIYDLRTKQLVRTMDRGLPAVFKQNKLIIAPNNGPITIWNVETGELVNSLVGNYSGSILSIELNKDHSLMLTGGLDEIVRLWDMIELRQVRTFTGHEGYIRSVIFDEARGQVISGSQDKSIRVWNINDGSLINRLLGHSDTVSKLLLDEETGRFFSSAWDTAIIEWDSKSGIQRELATGHTDRIRDLIFSEDGQRLISSSDDKSIIIWDKESGQQIKRLNHTDTVIYLALNPLNGQLISTTGDRKLLFWPVKP